MKELILLLTLLAPAGGVEIHLPPAAEGGEAGEHVPIFGEEVPLRVTLDGEPAAEALVTATYRPGSNVERSKELGRTRSDGTIEWVADFPGLAQLDAVVKTGEIEGVEQTRKGTKTVSIRFRRTPWSGVIVLLVAGGFLFGGAILAFLKMMRG